MQSNADQGKPATSDGAYIDVSQAGYGGQPPPPSYAPQSVPAAYMAQSAAPAYYGGGPAYGAPQYGAHVQYGGAPAAVGFAQPVGPQNVQVNMVGATAQAPQTIIIAQPATVLAPVSYLGWSIFNLLCCFWPLGLAALIYSIKVGSARSPDEAKGYSLTARNLNIAATVIGPVLTVIIVGAYFGSVAAALAHATNICYRSSSYGSYYSYSYAYTYSYYC